jgi:GTP-binding protein Era
MWDVESTLYVHRASQKAIVIGPKGRMLRAVKRKAEPELSEMFGVDVRLNIWIKIEKGWDENYFILKQMGYVR